MRFSKFLCSRSAGRSSVVLALGLVAQFHAAADTFVSSSGNFVGGAANAGVNNVVNNVTGGKVNPKGHYNLEAYASDSLMPPPLDRKSGPKPYVAPPAGQANSTDFQVADETGRAFDANAYAHITYPAAGNWSSAGSYASVCGPLNSDSPGGTHQPCGNNPNGETAEAKSQVRDPWSFGLLPNALTFDNTVTFDAGLGLQAFATGDDLAGASLFADDSTTLDGLGTLWTLSWGTDSTHPGVSSVVFWSNPALGLNDALITSEFEALLSHNASTGLSVLTQSFSFDYQLTIPANTNAKFSGDVTYEADGVTGAPEPSSLILAMLGASLLIASRARWSRRGQSMMVTETGREI